MLGKRHCSSFLYSAGLKCNTILPLGMHVCLKQQMVLIVWCFCDKVKCSLEGKNVKFTGYNLNEFFLTQEFKNSQLTFEAIATITVAFMKPSGTMNFVSFNQYICSEVDGGYLCFVQWGKWGLKMLCITVPRLFVTTSLYLIPSVLS